MEEEKDAIAGVEAALLEIYRAHFRTDDRKHETIAQLKLRCLKKKGKVQSF